MSKSTSKNSKLGGGCLFLFALPFAAVGVFMLGWIGKDLLAWQAMQSWVPVSAQLDAVDLDTNHDDDGTTYRVTARYHYTVDGREFTGTRVGIDDTADNIGHYHEETYAELEGLRGRPGALSCYVDPANPAKAVIKRDLRWGMVLFKGLFGLVFGGVGFGLMIGAIAGGRKVAAVAKRQAENPDAPWLWDTGGTPGVIASGSAAGTLFLWIFAGFWNAISLPAAIFAYRDGVFADNPPALLILLFPLVGSGLLVGAVYATLQRRKYGRSELRLAQFPAVLGGPLRGVVHVSKPIDAIEGYRLTVSCLEDTTTGSGKNRSTHTKTLWQDTRSLALPAASGSEGTDIPVLFALPYNMPQTDERDSDHKTYWTLEVHAPVSGIDFKETFRVPTYRTDASREDFVLDESLLTPFLDPNQDDGELRAARVYIDEGVNGILTIRIPAPRHVTLAVMVTLFGAIFAGVGYGVGIVVDDDSIMTTLFALLFGGIGLLMLLWSTFLWLSAWHIRVGQGAIAVRGGFLALGRTRTVLSADVVSIDATSNTSVGNTMLYNITLSTKEGAKISLGNLLPNQRLAQRLIDKIIAAL